MIVIMSMIYNLNGIMPSRDIVEFIADNIELLPIDTKDLHILVNTSPAEEFEYVRQKTFDGELDLFIFVGSPVAYTEQNMRSTVGICLYLAKKSIYCTNDYKLKPPSQCKSGALKEFADYKGESKDYYGFDYVVSTLPNLLYKGTSLYVNWNMSVFDMSYPLDNYDMRQDGLLYFGAFRNERRPLFEKYLDSIDYDVIISCSSGPYTLDNFKSVAPFAQYVKKLSSESFQNYKATIIIEDPYSNKTFTSLPTRFYECLAYGIVMFFDESMIFNLDNSHILDYQEYIVHNEFELAEKLKEYDLEYHARKQRTSWLNNFREILLEQWKDAIGIIYDEQ